MARHLLFALPLVFAATPAPAAHDCDHNGDCHDNVSCIRDESQLIGGFCDNEWDYCNVGERSCDYGDGDCDPGECNEGLICASNVGHAFGYFSNDVDVCVQDWSYCSPGSPCPYTVGDCDRDTDCEAGLACGWNQGPSFGGEPGADICVYAWQWWLH